jgi:hypothetical protein
MRNGEAPMTEGRRNNQMTKSEEILAGAKDFFVIRFSSLIRHSSFVIRHYRRIVWRDP